MSLSEFREKAMSRALIMTDAETPASELCIEEKLVKAAIHDAGQTGDPRYVTAHAVWTCQTTGRTSSDDVYIEDQSPLLALCDHNDTRHYHLVAFWHAAMLEAPDH